MTMKTLILALILTSFTFSAVHARHSCRTVDGLRTLIEREQPDATGGIMTDAQFEAFRGETNLQAGDQAVWFISPTMPTGYVGVLLNACQIGSGEFERGWLLRLLGEVAV